VRLDPEGIVLTRGGEVIVSSEGIGREPRVPPGLIRYSRTGAVIGLLDVRDRFLPTTTGPLVRGVRANYGFEALTLSPDGERLFTATETALAQDGEAATFESGTLARLLEYTADGASFRPAREFIYPIDPVVRPPFESSVVVKGLVELLALSRTEMLALERTYLENKATPGLGTNYARVYRVSIDGAADVSRLESLQHAGSRARVRKTLVLDLANVKGLSADLAPALDNFEALAFGPKLGDGSASLVMASDDNFSPNQRNWFLLFRIPNRWLTASAAPAATR
jgi:glycerophosphoryl diester phosphodiesterase